MRKGEFQLCELELGRDTPPPVGLGDELRRYGQRPSADPGAARGMVDARLGDRNSRGSDAPGLGVDRHVDVPIADREFGLGAVLVSDYHVLWQQNCEIPGVPAILRLRRGRG